MTVLARAYQWLSTDSILPFRTGDAGGDYALANAKNYSLLQRGRTTAADNDDGLEYRLTSPVSLYCAEVVNCLDATGLLTRFAAHSVSPYVSPGDGVNSGPDVSARPDVYDDLSYLDVEPVRPNWVIGFDAFAVGPAPDGALASVTCQSGEVSWRTAPAGASYFELGFLALGVDGVEIKNPNEIDVAGVRLVHGYGWRSSLSWDLLTLDHFSSLETLWRSSHSGGLPAFVFPDPGAKDGNGKHQSTENMTPARRGGLVRILPPGPKYRISSEREDYVFGVSMEIESWDDSPTSGAP